MRLGHFRALSIAISLVLLPFLTACESVRAVKPDLASLSGPSVSGDPCQNADWFEVGRVDGLSGIPLHTSGYVGRCISRGVQVNEELYFAGWQRGLIDYCTPERAFDAGHNGESYAGICPKNLEPIFLKRFDVGRKIHDLESENARLEKEVDRKVLELETLSGTSTESILGDALARLPGTDVLSDPEARKQRQASLQSEVKKLRDVLAGNESTIQQLETKASL